VRCSLQMRVSNHEVGRERAGLGLDAFVGFALVAVGAGRCAPYIDSVGSRSRRSGEIRPMS
jgi:hypothetical protein